MLSFCALFSAASNGKAITSQVAVTGLSMGFGVMFGVMLLIVALLQMPCCRTNSMVALSSFGVGRRDWWKGLPTVLTEPTSLHECAPLQHTLNPPYSMYQSILNLYTLLQHTENERVIYLGYSFNVANQPKRKKSQTKKKKKKNQIQIWMTERSTRTLIFSSSTLSVPQQTLLHR